MFGHSFAYVAHFVFLRAEMSGFEPTDFIDGTERGRVKRGRGGRGEKSGIKRKRKKLREKERKGELSMAKHKEAF